MKIELKNIKTFMGISGYGLNAELFVNNKYVAFVIDNADGSSYTYHIKNKITFENLKSKIETQTYINPISGDKSKMDMDTFIAFVCDEIENNKTKKDITIQRWLNYKVK